MVSVLRMKVIKFHKDGREDWSVPAVLLFTPS